jgi:hypothetical protein
MEEENIDHGHDRMNNTLVDESLGSYLTQLIIFLCSYNVILTQ